MIIFNTTFHIDDDVHEQCLAFLKNNYIPHAMASGFLHAPRFAHIHRQHEEAGVSYSLQFYVKNVDTLNYWLQSDGQKLQEELVKRFGNKVLGFVTLMDEVEL